MRRVRVVSSLSFFDSVMLGIGFIVGSGIFIMPLIAAETSGTYSIVAWVVGGIYQILTGLCFAECAMKIPKVGGLYSYAHKAYGDFTGFFAGWTFWIGYLVTIAAEQWALGWYLQFFLPQYSLLIRVTIGVLTGLVLTYLNFRGVKLGGRIEDYFTVGKLLIIALFIIGALIFFKLANFYPLIPPGTNLFPAIGSTSIIVLYAYLGEEIITVPEGESEKAKKLIPKAIMIASVSTMIIYLLVVVAFLGAARWTSFTASQSPLAAVFRQHNPLGDRWDNNHGRGRSRHNRLTERSDPRNCKNSDRHVKRWIVPKNIRKDKRETPDTLHVLADPNGHCGDPDLHGQGFCHAGFDRGLLHDIPIRDHRFCDPGANQEGGRKTGHPAFEGDSVDNGTGLDNTAWHLSGPAVSPRSDSGPVLCRAADLHRAKEDPQAVKTWEMQPCGQVSLPACSSVFP